MENDDTLRAEFEKLYPTEIDKRALEKTVTGSYKLMQTHLHWSGFQDGYRLAHARFAEREKLNKKIAAKLKWFLDFESEHCGESGHKAIKTAITQGYNLLAKLRAHGGATCSEQS